MSLLSWLKNTLQNGWHLYGDRILVAVTLLLTALLAFWAGTLHSRLAMQPDPLIIRVTEGTPISPTPTQPLVISGASSDIPPVPPQVPTPACDYVGSRKSTKYHHPQSRCAKQIKPENIRCFATIDEATSKGYTPGCLEP